MHCAMRLIGDGPINVNVANDAEVLPNVGGKGPSGGGASEDGPA